MDCGQLLHGAGLRAMGLVLFELKCEVCEQCRTVALAGVLHCMVWLASLALMLTGSISLLSCPGL